MAEESKSSSNTASHVGAVPASHVGALPVTQAALPVTQATRKKKQELDRDEVLRQTGGGIARYFAPLQHSVHAENAQQAAETFQAEAEADETSPARSSLPGPTQMWAPISPSVSRHSPAPSTSHSLSPCTPAAPRVSPHMSRAELSRTGDAILLPVLSAGMLEGQDGREFVAVTPQQQVRVIEERQQEQAPAASNLDSSLRSTSPASPASQGSFPGPTQMWGAGLEEAEPQGETLAAANVAAGPATARRRSISPTLTFHGPSPLRHQQPTVASEPAHGRLETPRPVRRSVSPTLSFHSKSPPCRAAVRGVTVSVDSAAADGTGRPLKRQRSLSPTLSFHAASPEDQAARSATADATAANEAAGDGNSRQLKKQRSLSPTLSFHLPSPARLRSVAPDT